MEYVEEGVIPLFDGLMQFSFTWKVESVIRHIDELLVHIKEMSRSAHLI